MEMIVTNDVNLYVSKHFRAGEFKAKSAEAYDSVIFIAQELIDALEEIREHFNAPVTITSGYRSGLHNKAVGGATNSKHMYGMAADIKVYGIPAYSVYMWCSDHWPDKYGIGKYDTWTHIDIREDKARW